MKIRLALVLLLITLPVFAKNTILVVGDSLSASYGINRTQGWVNLLQQKLQQNHYDFQVINLSISGNTTSNGLARLPQALQKYKPQITIIELGGNDGLRGLQLSTIKQNLQNMITLSKRANSKVLLLAIRLPPNLGEDYISNFYQIYLSLAKENNISLVPFLLKDIDTNSGLMQADQIHPTEKAQSLILNNVWPELIKILKNYSS